MPRTPENRDATVVYPSTSPELVLAYRIFGPGYDSLEALAEQKTTIIRPSFDLTTEGGGTELTALGEDLATTMDLEVGQIKSEGEGEGEEPAPERELTRAEILAQYLEPPFWLSRDEALLRTRAHRAKLERMHATIGKFIGIYTTRLPYAKPLAQAMKGFVDRFMRWYNDAMRLERFIELHDNGKPVSTWLSPDTRGVTYGPRVPHLLCMFWELDSLMGGMYRSLAHCDHLRRRLLVPGTTTELRKRFYHELVFNMRRFASMCVIQEVREGFVKGLEEERRQWSPESSPGSEEYATDFEDFSSNSESGSDGEDDDMEDQDDQETRAANDTAAPMQE
ncbi:hypothetical protein DHEL01_v208211 [Diaporthe helianthi]|uniref:Uncharacterized protein n=1 Tax=Diaporthe helianthi TaxID=158607 RepID=A0A2P5HT19_DIAHE|nr:hypothetical protein DHEL01_v208211 [Diaporthe helianthi]